MANWYLPFESETDQSASEERSESMACRLRVGTNSFLIKARLDGLIQKTNRLAVVMLIRDFSDMQAV